MVLAVVALGWLASSCSHARPAVQGTPEPSTTTTAGLYVAIGAGDSRGEGTDNPLRDAWTQVFFRTLPQGFVFVNLASNGATTADAVNEQLPEAEALHPTLVTVSLGVNDLLGSVPAARYQAELTALIQGLGAGAARVLVASVPALPSVPAAGVAAYNAVIRSVAADSGAEVVDLGAAGAAIDDRAVAAGGGAGPFGSDGFDPDVASAQAIAALFEHAWRSP